MGTWTRLGHEKMGKSKVILKGSCRFVGRWMGSWIRRAGLRVELGVGTTTPTPSAGIGRRISYSSEKASRLALRN